MANCSRFAALANARLWTGIWAALLLTISACHGRRHPEERAQVPKTAPKVEETCDADGWCVSKPSAVELAGKALCAVWGASPNDAWAVGDTIAHWDGVRWSRWKGAPPIAQPQRGCALKAIHGSSADAVWAVGAGRALFWNGKKFAEYALPMDAADVFVNAKDDAWTVSAAGSIAHFDGLKWTEVPVPSQLTLNAVFCGDRRACWAAGDHVDGDVEPNGSSKLLRWDGQAWHEESLGVPGARAISGTAPDDVWAVGAWGRIYHFDGTRWAPSSSPSQRTLYAVRAAARNDVWATGEDGLVMHFDGQAWSAAKPTWPRITGLSVVSPRELWASNGAILHWHAAAFQPRPSLSKDLWDPAKPTPSQSQVEDTEHARLVRYLKSLVAGRAATKAAKYASAASAFTAALEARPGDPRAYAERGYAQYLAKNLGDAELDLQHAAEHADERSLRAQTFFNLGLVREAQGRDGTSAFALSRFLHPTPAAEQKLVGKSACAVEIDRSPTAIVYRQFPSWLTFYEQEGPSLGAEGKPATGAAAKRILCELWQPATPGPKVDACRGPAPWVITDNRRSAFVVNETKQGLSVATAGSADGGMFCPLGTFAEVLARAGDVALVRAFGGWGNSSMLCDADGHDCTSQELDEIAQDSDSHEWVHGCAWQGYTKYEVLDLAHDSPLLVVTQYDNANKGAKDSEQVQISADAGGIALKGPGCDQLLPLK